ncbi:hypothetical protein AArc1_2162 [Natrarchaeobaculum sulfurireducens]|uniref:Uncharacterized protein n=1 Tax=Natrarchaeobaculum sulfurireducens TaxID=2044521 RepID=A0A346PG33_9EURY|nr:hypothetical protein AArc1_2162 [Natrarchaeobaculum sulfurireducens]
MAPLPGSRCQSQTRRRRTVVMEVSPMRKAVFVPASELYDVSSRTPIVHPAYLVTDNDVRQTFEDGGSQ